MSSPYYYPDTQVYRNRFDLRDPGLLAEAESIATAARVAELARQPVAGDLDFTYLQNIHHYLLQDVYDWAGEIRTVQTYAGDTGIPHDPPESIPDEAQRIFGELADANHLRGLSRTSSPRLSPSTGRPHLTAPVRRRQQPHPTPLRRPARPAGRMGDRLACCQRTAPSKRLETSLSSTAARSSATSSSPSSSPPAQSPPRLSQPRRATTRWTPPTTGAQ
ncbi:hypothetical protein GS416_05655 [Rhodococcus hoagii]|nr:hypothetical protein [Prescottella equi]